MNIDPLLALLVIAGLYFVVGSVVRFRKERKESGKGARPTTKHSQR